jgi:hypothetical protein
MKTRKNHSHLFYKKVKYPIPTTVIPKGTLLFRGVKNPKSDFAGIPQPDGTYKLTPDYNVFFYPYPFIADLDPEHYNDFTKYNNSVEVYETQVPIQIVSLISPSRFTRAHRMLNQFLTGCKGREYDPCFMKEFRDKYPMILGMEAIGGSDGKLFQASFKDLPPSEQAYIHWSSNVRPSNPIGIKEYILYPLKKRYNTIIKNVNAWMREKKNEFLYHHVTTLSRANKNKEIHEFMESKAKFNPSTKLWSLV